MNTGGKQLRVCLTSHIHLLHTWSGSNTFLHASRTCRKTKNRILLHVLLLAPFPSWMHIRGLSRSEIAPLPHGSFRKKRSWTHRKDDYSQPVIFQCLQIVFHVQSIESIEHLYNRYEIMPSNEELIPSWNPEGKGRSGTQVEARGAVRRSTDFFSRRLFVRRFCRRPKSSRQVLGCGNSRIHISSDKFMPFCAVSTYSVAFSYSFSNYSFALKSYILRPHASSILFGYCIWIAFVYLP